jgi:short-subunit dehydrogenase
MNTNFNGVLLVNNRFLPHLRERRSGLCLITGSVAGIFPIPFQSHYCASKAALDLYSSTLRMELRKYGVNVCLLMPGDTNTGFTSARKYVINEASPFYDDCLRAVKKMEKDELGGCRPAKAAQAMLRLSAQKKPPAHKIVGMDYKLLVFLRRLLPESATESILRSMYMRRQG